MRGVLQGCNITATLTAELSVMRAVRFRVIEFDCVSECALARKKFDVTDLLRAEAVGKRFVRGF